MDIDTLAAQEPQTIDDALDCMEMGLRFFHEAHDRRAIFLRLYYMMTLEVHAAINGSATTEGRGSSWTPTGSGRCRASSRPSTSRRSTPGARTRRGVERAWKARRQGRRSGPARRSSQNALLGINAHINYDLPRAIAANLDPARAERLPDACSCASSTTTRSTTCWSGRCNPVQESSPRTTRRASPPRQAAGQPRRAGERGGAAALPRAGLVGRARLRLGPRRGAQRGSSATSWNGSPTVRVPRTKRVSWMPGARARAAGRALSAGAGTGPLEPVGGVDVPTRTAVNPLARPAGRLRHAGSAT